MSKEIYPLLTVFYLGRYFRVMQVGKRLSQIHSKHSRGILEIGKHWPISSFKFMLRQGRLKEISKEQAERLQNSLPPALGTKPSDFPPRKPKQRQIRLYLEPALQEQIKALAKKRGTSASRLQREWVRMGLALALDQENAR